MPLISEFYGIKIYINYLDHNPPHIHVYYAEHSALVSIAELKFSKAICQRSRKNWFWNGCLRIEKRCKKIGIVLQNERHLLKLSR